MLNEAPNKNDVTRVANIMLNEAPNGNDAMRIISRYMKQLFHMYEYNLKSKLLDLNYYGTYHVGTIQYCHSTHGEDCWVVIITAIGTQQFSMAAI